MGAIIALTFALYFILVGVRGNAPALFAELANEKQFLLWIIVMLVVAALWESENAEQVAKPLAALIVMGFLIRNIQTLRTNAAALGS